MIPPLSLSLIVLFFLQAAPIFGDEVKLVKSEKGYAVETEVYSARVSNKGSLESLKIEGVEFINQGLEQQNNGKAVKVPGIFASNHKAASSNDRFSLQKVSEHEGNRLKAEGDNWFLEYVFLEDTIKLVFDGDPSPVQKGFSQGHPCVQLNVSLSNEIHRSCDPNNQGEFGWPVNRIMEPGNYAVLAPNGAGIIFEKSSRIKSDVNKDKFSSPGHVLNTLCFDYVGGHKKDEALVRELKLFKKADLAHSLTLVIESPNPNHMFPNGEDVVFPVTVKAHYGHKLDGELLFKGSPYVWKKPEVNSAVPLTLSPEAPVKKLSLPIMPSKPGHYTGVIGVADGEEFLYRQRIGFMFEPERIPAAQPPADFDEFWDQTLKELEKVPLDLTLENQKEMETDKGNVYKARFRTWKGQWAQAWLYVPKAEGKFTGTVVCPPVSNYQPGLARPATGAFQIQVAVHGGDLSTRPAESSFNYMSTGIESKDTYMFRHGFCCLVRCYDIIKNHAKSNGEVEIFGSSQGGGLAFALGGLRPDAKSIKSQLPAYVRPDWTVLGQTRWGPRCPSGKDPKEIAEVVRYFDTANFTHLIKSPLQIAFGLFDWCGTAEGVFTAINAMPKDVPCKVIIDPYGGHFSFDYKLIQAQQPSEVPRWEGTAKENKVAR